MLKAKSPLEALKAMPKRRKTGAPGYLDTIPPKAAEWVRGFVAELKKMPPGERPPYPELIAVIQDNAGVQMCHGTLRKLITE